MNKKFSLLAFFILGSFSIGAFQNCGEGYSAKGGLSFASSTLSQASNSVAGLVPGARMADPAPGGGTSGYDGKPHYLSYSTKNPCAIPAGETQPPPNAVIVIDEGAMLLIRNDCEDLAVPKNVIGQTSKLPNPLPDSQGGLVDAINVGGIIFYSAEEMVLNTAPTI